MKPVRRVIVGAGLIVVLVAALVVGMRWWRFSLTHVETDDAYVHADVAEVTPRIAGTVDQLLVDEDWQVQRGQTLARLDPAEYRVGLRRAEAALARAIEGVEQSRAAVRAAESSMSLAEAELEQARLDHARAAQLTAHDVVPTERLDRARTALRAAEARSAASREEAERARANLGIPLDAPHDEAAVVRQARAERDQAALLLSYTRLRAPVAGVVTRRAVEVGQRIQPGQALMAIVPIDEAYVEANFKETQLTDVRIGQPVRLVADIYPRHVFRGRVDGLSPGTGAAFALLPPENATGNWVKVVQRVPVRIRLDEPADPELPLRVGLSVVATIDTSNREGALLTPLSQSAGSAQSDHEKVSVLR
ncbi:MAG TPA: HlyD family secretion protein [Candidatus Bathyarchaeia archaeon]|nr:HlyD family secretion protein [Candidatus Bathyarchaeia archaeon]